MKNSLNKKLNNITNGKFMSKDFIIADAKDADMGGGVPAPGNKRDYKTGVLQPYFIDDVAYTIDSHGLISAIKLSDGNTLWEASLDMKVSSGLTIHNKNIY